MYVSLYSLCIFIHIVKKRLVVGRKVTLTLTELVSWGIWRVVVVVFQSRLESRRVNVGRVGTQAEEPLPALCCVVKCNTL
jgi:hypothetical protein